MKRYETKMKPKFKIYFTQNHKVDISVEFEFDNKTETSKFYYRSPLVY
jgi:hypothetical protein